MLAKIVSIGNSSGILLPSALLSSLGLKKNDRVSYAETEDGFMVKKVLDEPKNFEALLEDYYGLPFRLAVSKFSEEEDDVSIDWGEARGEELLE